LQNRLIEIGARSQLSYKTLAVQRGDHAQTVWDEMILCSDLAKKAQANTYPCSEAIADLRAYCQLDTLAMVEIHQALLKLISSRNDDN
jgi:hypothetical protein